MAGPHRRFGPVLGLIAALLIVLVPAPAAHAASSWDGSVDLYRKGTFTTQKSWLWCTAAGVQIVRNIVDGERDHSTAAQRRYFNWMRQSNRYDLPESAGVDPAGWTAGLRRFVDDRYRLVSSETFLGALRLAVKRIRATELPVALTMSNGGHGWILHGFTATADPLTEPDFRITSVRVSGPLWGLQSRSFGYDMRPNTKLTPAQLKRFFTPWRYAPKRMIWDGRYVSIQPVPAPAKARVAPAVPVPSPALTPSPTVPIAVVTVPSSSPPASPAPVAVRPSPTPALAATPTATTGTPAGPIGAVVVMVLALAVGVGAIARQRSSRSTG